MALKVDLLTMPDILKYKLHIVNCCNINKWLLRWSASVNMQVASDLYWCTNNQFEYTVIHTHILQW